MKKYCRVPIGVLFLLVVLLSACSVHAYADGNYVYVGQLGGPEQFWQPGGMIIDSDGILWVSDGSNNRIWQIDSSTGLFKRWFGGCDHPDNEDGFGHWHDVDSDHMPMFGTGVGQFGYPQGMDIDRTGTIYIVDTLNNRIQRISSDGTVLEPWKSEVWPLNSPSHLAIDSIDNVYVSDINNNRVIKISDGVWSKFCDILYPWGVTVDKDNQVYVTSPLNTVKKIWVYKSDGTAGEPVPSFGDPGLGEQQLNQPRAIEIGPDGNIYVAEPFFTETQRIKVFTLCGAYVSGWGHRGDDVEFGLNSINDIYCGPDGTIYVSDGEYGGTGHHVIKKYRAANPVPAMVPIPAGTFQMGNSKDPGEGMDWELPFHTVTLDSFAMGNYEITNGQYCAFLNSAYPSQLKVVNGVVYASSDTGNSFPYCSTSSASSRTPNWGEFSQIAFCNNTFSVRTKGGRDMTNDPMVCVSWYGAAAYCNWLSQQEDKQLCYNLSTWECDFSKKGYRLPTEAEWEYAARSRNYTPYYRFPWGDTISHTQANYYSNVDYIYDISPTPGFHPAWNEFAPYTSPVGSFPANGYGLCDMAGNVWEWCNDWFGSYTSVPQSNPTGPTTGNYRVHRGGGCYGLADYCRVSYRGNGGYPSYRIYDYGFRIVLPNKDLVGYWNFDEGTGANANDSSGNNYHGNIIGATWAQGILGGALQFNGSSNYVQLPVGQGYAFTNGITIQAWIKSTDPDGCTGIVCSRGPGDGAGSNYQALVMGGPNIIPSFTLMTPGIISASAGGPDPVNNGKWHHLVATYDNNVIAIYVDGVKFSNPASGTVTTLADFKIGWDNALYAGGETPRWFQGLIDEVRIYNRALTLEEVLGLYNAPLRIVSPNGGDSLTTGSPVNIKWTGSGTSSQVDLDYSTDNGITWVSIAKDLANTGQYVWTVPTVKSDTCLIRVSDSDNADIKDVSDAVFSIYSCGLTFEFMPPAWGNTNNPDLDFNRPSGMATDPQGYIYVADETNNRIKKYDADGTLIAWLGGCDSPSEHPDYIPGIPNRGHWHQPGTGHYPVFGNGQPGQFKNPSGIAIDEAGFLYVVENLYPRIQKIIPSSSDPLVFETVEFWNISASGSTPNQIAVDKNGHAYVSDSGRALVLKFNTTNGLLLDSWNGSVSGDTFGNPVGLAVDSDGLVYISDFFKSRIVVLNSNGEFQREWGESGSGDNQFYYQTDITFDSKDRLFVVDRGGYIKVFTKNGQFMTKWGSHGSDPGQFLWASGITLGLDGDVFVADTHNYRVQKFTNEDPCNNRPVANAGPDQTEHVGVTINLDGSASYDPDGDPLTYRWSIISQPPGSIIILDNATLVNPWFTPDLPGEYVVQLIVTDSKGVPSEPDTVTISTNNSAPIAKAGPDQELKVLDTTVYLGTTLGDQSSDPDGDTITYQWSFQSKPVGSNAVLLNATTATPSFVADVYGDYIVELVVSDPWVPSEPDTVNISFDNIPPVACITGNLSRFVGEDVLLDGSCSYDANGDALTYEWSFTSKPVGSQAEIENPTDVLASFVPDLLGTYVVNLTVHDGLLPSETPATVTITVVSCPSVVIVLLQETMDVINALPPSAFKNNNQKKTFTNKISAVIEMVEMGIFTDAADKLLHDVMAKTDGCATGGKPDKNDWILTCSAQQPVYERLNQAFILLVLLQE